MAVFKLGKQFPLTDPGNVLFSRSHNFVGQLFLFSHAHSQQTKTEKNPEIKQRNKKQMDLRFDNTKGHHWALRFF